MHYGVRCQSGAAAALWIARRFSLTPAAGTGPAQPAAAQKAVFGYDDVNRLTSLTLPNGLAALYTLDDAGQLRNISYWKTGHVLLGNLAYTYDDRGLIATRNGTLGGTLLPPATIAPSQHDANNTLTLWNNIVPTYDLNGQLTQLGGQQYKWNPRGQLTRFTAGSTTATFQYDALGRRRSKTVNGVTTMYLHDGRTPIQEQDGTGQVKANNLTGLGIDQYLARYQNGQSYSYVTDVQGSTLRLTDAAQAVVATYLYDPYGNTYTDNPSLENPYQYTGRENDGTGLYYYRARYYHPRLGRFISEDPIGLAGGDNLYRYVRSNPINRIDPLGLHDLGPIIGPGLEDFQDWLLGLVFGESVPPLPTDLVGDNARGSSGKRINTDLPADALPGVIKDLTGGKLTDDGEQKVCPNKVRIRPGKSGEGPRIDIPANGSKPPETIHFPPGTPWPF